MRSILTKVSVNIGIGLILILVWSRFVDLNEIILKLKSANLIYVLLVFLSIAVSGAIRAARFKKILNIPTISLKELVFLNYLSQLLSFLIPIRAGEITKGVYLATQHNIAFTKSIIWVLIDRFLDFWMFIVVVAVFLPLVSSNISESLVRLIIIAFVVLTVLLIVSIKSAVYLEKMIAFFLPVLVFPKLKKIFISLSNKIIEGFKILDRSPKEWGSFIILSTLAVISDGFTWYLSFHALNINITFFQAMLGNALAAFTFLVPAAPGYVGSAEAVGLAIFGGILGLDANLSSAATVLFHLITIVTLLTLGISGLFFLKFDLNFVWKKLKGN
ncbi:MAG: lysylphosphatidylglycerol synthase transmembrane domain-containing protein [Candidatus Daviesbacteria bacterium]|nr:lysylphosphatidylglycerol synthase transmembrane domain-containing protein [Candidatus Daviesbacteria bacterium]